MKFQPGESGNPAGRPAGSRNKKTLEAEEVLAARAQATVAKILDRADAGEPAAMRLCMDRIAPTGANRPVPIELPPVDTPDDVAAAARVVTSALAQGAVTAREAISLLTVVERLARIAERVQQMRERHWVWQGGAGQSERSFKEAARAAPPAVRKEEGPADPSLYSPVDSAAAPEGAEGEGLYSPVNSANGAAGERNSAADQAKGDGLYFPVNSEKGTAVDTPNAGVSGEATGGKASVNLVRRRRRELMTGTAPRALRINETPVDPRCYVTEQTWLASMLRNEASGPMKRDAA